MNILFLRGLLPYNIKNLKIFYGRRAWSTTIKCNNLLTEIITFYYHETYKNQTPDPEAYLKSLGPVRRMGAKKDPNSYYHQIGGKKQGILGKIFGNRRR